MIPADISPDTARRMFRGKRVDNGEWVYGYYFKDRYGDEFIIPVPDRTGFGTEPIRVRIYEGKSVGQCLGMKDARDTWAFCGDIIEATDGFTDKKFLTTAKYFRGEFLLVWGDDGEASADLWIKEGRIVGNIHDNPNLLEGGA